MSLKQFFGWVPLLVTVLSISLNASNSETQERIRLIHADWGGGKKIGDRIVRLLVGNVEFRQGEAYMKCDSSVQYPEEGRLDFLGHVEIFNNKKWLYADKVSYYEKPQIEIAEGNVRLVDTTKVLTSQRLKYFEKDEKAFANDSVRIVDEQDRLTLTGQYGEYFRSDGYAKVAGSPFLSKRDSTDTIELTISGIEMEMFDDGKRVMVRDSVIITRGAVRATCGEVEFLDDEDRIVLRKEPKAKRKLDDLWGDEIVLTLKDTDVRAIEITGNALIMSKVDSVNQADDRFNFLSGEDILVWVQDEAIDSVKVSGRAVSYYYVIEEGEDNGLNKVLGDELWLYFSEGELKRVRVFSTPGSTTGTYYPPDQVKLIETELSTLAKSRPLAQGDEHTLSK